MTAHGQTGRSLVDTGLNPGSLTPGPLHYPVQESDGHLCIYGFCFIDEPNYLFFTKSYSRHHRDTRRSRITLILQDVAIYVERKGIKLDSGYPCVVK